MGTKIVFQERGIEEPMATSAFIVTSFWSVRHWLISDTSVSVRIQLGDWLVGYKIDSG